MTATELVNEIKTLTTLLESMRDVLRHEPITPSGSTDTYPSSSTVDIQTATIRTRIEEAKNSIVKLHEALSEEHGTDSNGEGAM